VAALPIFYDDLKSSVKAAMIFPCDQKKAKVYVGWLHAHELCHSDAEALRHTPVRSEEYLIKVARDAADFAPHHQEAIENLNRGYIVAFLVGALWGLICSELEKAGWEGAIQITEKLTKKIKISGSRTEFRDCLNAFQPVLHLLGARFLRFARLMQPTDLDNVAERILVSDKDLLSSVSDDTIGYLPEIDLCFLLQEATLLRQQLQRWNRGRPSPSRLLTDEMFEFDIDHGLLRKLTRLRPADWPNAGVLVPWNFYPDSIPSRGRPGRPRKTLF
jgi:hypothetical protein